VPIERVTLVFIHHPVFEEPSHDATLWRYMDFTRFVALLEHRALFFSGISGFPDRFEASLTPRLTAQLEAMGGQALDDWRNWPRLTFLNCWNEDAHENVALWNTYASAAGGVAIKSSLNRILQALHPDDSGLIPPDELHAGRVRYVDYATATIPHDNANWPLLHKRLGYRFEHEVRLALWPQRLLRAGEAVNDQAPVTAAVPLAPSGYDVGLDPNVLIEAVVVAPDAPEWLLELVESVARRYGVTGTVVRSDLDAEPTR
jgi:hypothetical protein